MRIRPARPDDRADLYAICLRTGAAGQDASGQYDDPDLLGEVFVGPYLALEPRFAFVATGEGSDDAARGYCLGALDSAEFAERCERAWWPGLRARHPLEAPRRQTDRALVQLIHHPLVLPAALVDAYPSHLHIDLLPSLQGQGAGRALIEHLLDVLSAAGSRGVHLGVALENVRAAGFYQRLGFIELGRDQGTLVLARPLS